MSGRHCHQPIEYTISKTQFIVMATALALIVGALSFPLAWILFRVIA